MRELLRREHGRIRRNDQRGTDDGGAASDLTRADRAYRHPAVIAALSGLEHLRLAARLQLALIRNGLGCRALGGGPHFLRWERHDAKVEAFLGEESLVPRHEHVETHERRHPLDRQRHGHGTLLGSRLPQESRDTFMSTIRRIDRSWSAT